MNSDQGLRRLAAGTLLVVVPGRHRARAGCWTSWRPASAASRCSASTATSRAPDQLAALTAQLREAGEPGHLDRRGGRRRHPARRYHVGQPLSGQRRARRRRRHRADPAGLPVDRRRAGGAAASTSTSRPSADVNTADDNPVIGTRSFGVGRRPGRPAHRRGGRRACSRRASPRASSTSPATAPPGQDSHLEVPLVDADLDLLRAPRAGAVPRRDRGRDQVDHDRARTGARHHRCDARHAVPRRDHRAAARRARLRRRGHLRRARHGGGQRRDRHGRRRGLRAGRGRRPAVPGPNSRPRRRPRGSSAAIIGAVRDGRLPPGRAGDAAERSPALRAWLGAPHPRRGRAARRAGGRPPRRPPHRVGAAPLVGPPLVVEVGGHRQHRGRADVPWGLGPWLPRRRRSCGSSRTTPTCRAPGGRRPLPGRRGQGRAPARRPAARWSRRC